MAGTTSWMIGLLGSFRLERAGEVVLRFERRKDELLLAYLALQPDTRHWRQDLVATLWPGRDPLTARRNLSYVLWAIRSQLRSVGLADGLFVGTHSIQLNPAVDTDVRRFRELADGAALASDPRERLAGLLAALALFGEGLLPGYDEPWLGDQRARLAGLAAETRRQVAAQHALLLAHDSGAPPRGPHATDRDHAPEARVLPGVAAEAPGADRDWPALIALADDLEIRLAGRERAAALAQLDAAWPNVRAHLDAAVAREDRVRGLALAAPVWRYWYLRERLGEGRWYLDRLLAMRQPLGLRLAARAHTAAGALAAQDRDVPAARRNLETALALWQQLDDDTGLMRAVANLGSVEQTAGELERALALHQQAATIARRLEIWPSQMSTLLNLAQTAFHLKDYALAGDCLTERLRLAERAGDEAALATTFANLATLALAEDDHDAALDYAHRALSQYATSGKRRDIAFAYRLIGRAEHWRGRYAEAHAAFDASLSAAREAEDMRAVGDTLYYLAETIEAEGDASEAIATAQHAADLLRASGDVPTTRKAERLLEQLRGDSPGAPAPDLAADD